MQLENIRAKLSKVEAERHNILIYLFQRAIDFYTLQGDNAKSRTEHRLISQDMAEIAVELALPTIIEKIINNNLDHIALIAPLRGGLALVTPSTVSYLRQRVQYILDQDIPVEAWPVGVKRNTANDSANIYFSRGYRNQAERNQSVLAISLDWGTATGVTNETIARDMQREGIGFGNMIALTMTVPDLALKRLSALTDQTGSLTVLPATRSRLNEIMYINALSPADGGEFQTVIPKDWGDVQFGNWSVASGANPVDVHDRITDFMNEFRVTFAPVIQESDEISLEAYYTQLYVQGNKSVLPIG